MTINTRPARKADVTELSHALGRAFYDDPVSVWIMPDDKARAARQRKFFAAIARHHHLAGGGVEVASDGSDDRCGGAVGSAGPLEAVGARTTDDVAVVHFRIRVERDDGPQTRPAARSDEETSPRGTALVSRCDRQRPAVRGKGYGQALMRSRLDRVDAEHAPAYLESSKAENVPYYQRFGFEVSGELVVPMAARPCGRCGGRRAEGSAATVWTAGTPTGVDYRPAALGLPAVKSPPEPSSQGTQRSMSRPNGSAT